VHDPENHDPVEIGAIVDAALPIGKAAQAGRNMVTRRAGEIDLGDPGDLGSDVRQEFPGIEGAAFCDKATDGTQVSTRKRCYDEALGANDRRLRS
jgi:hypothetical protein